MQFYKFLFKNKKAVRARYNFQEYNTKIKLQIGRGKQKDLVSQSPYINRIHSLSTLFLYSLSTFNKHSR